jgi:hypothetical protein
MQRESYKDPLLPRTAKPKQNPVTVGNRTIYRALPSERTLYSLRYHLRHYFMGPFDYNKILHFVCSVGLLKDWNKGGCKINH